MSVREIKVQFDTSQLDGRYATCDWVGDMEANIYNNIYTKDEVDNRIFETLDHIGVATSGPSLSSRIDELQRDVSFKCGDIEISISDLYNNLREVSEQLRELKEKIEQPKEEENPFYALIETVYKK